MESREWLEEVSASSSVKEELLMAMCIAQQSNPTCAVYYEAASSKTCFANCPVPAQTIKRDARMELLRRVQGLWRTSAGRNVPSSATPEQLLPREMDLLCPGWLCQGRSLANDLWWPWAGEESHLIPVLPARFSVCTSPSKRFSPASEISGTRGIWQGWDDLVCKWLCSWPGNSSCFSFVLPLRWNQWKHFNKVSTSCPGGKYLQRVPFAGAAGLNTAQGIRKHVEFGNFIHWHHH